MLGGRVYAVYAAMVPAAMPPRYAAGRPAATFRGSSAPLDQTEEQVRYESFAKLGSEAVDGFGHGFPSVVDGDLVAAVFEDQQLFPR